MIEIGSALEKQVFSGAGNFLFLDLEGGVLHSHFVHFLMNVYFKLKTQNHRRQYFLQKSLTTIIPHWDNYELSSGMYKGGITKHPDKILSEKECVPGLAKKEKKKKLRLTNLFKFPKPLKNFHIKGWKKIFPP